jgi:hypothetical protein
VLCFKWRGDLVLLLPIPAHWTTGLRFTLLQKRITLGATTFDHLDTISRLTLPLCASHRDENLIGYNADTVERGYSTSTVLWHFVGNLTKPWDRTASSTATTVGVTVEAFRTVYTLYYEYRKRGGNR